MITVINDIFIFVLFQDVTSRKQRTSSEMKRQYLPPKHYFQRLINFLSLLVFCKTAKIVVYRFANKCLC